MKRPKSVDSFFETAEYIQTLEEILEDKNKFIQVLSARLASKISSSGEAISLDCNAENLNQFTVAAQNGHLLVSITAGKTGTFLDCQGIVPAYTNEAGIHSKQILNILTQKELFIQEYQKYLDFSRDIDKIYKT